MTTGAISTFLSAGGGFDFEDAVAAYYLAAILNKRMPLGTAFHNIERIHWQGADLGWVLDDLVLKGASGFESGFSIKSDAHLKTTGFSQDFVERCWRQYRNKTGRPFNYSGDLLCLAVGNIAGDVSRAWQLLSGQIQNTSLERIEERFLSSQQGESLQMSKVQREIIQSLIEFAPDGIRPSLQDALTLLRHIRVLRFDFLDIPSQFDDVAVQSLQLLVESGSRDDALALWGNLVSISKGHRKGADLDYDQLIKELRSQCKLKALPDHSQLLEQWHQLSLERTRHSKWQVSTSLPPLERSGLWDALDSAIDSRQPIVLLGNSGSGKTTLVSEHTNRTGRRLFLLDPTLIASGGMLHGNNFKATGRRLSELLKAETRPALLLVDSVEKMTSVEVDSICSLILSVNHLLADNQIEIAITCLPMAYDSLRASFSRDQIGHFLLPILNPTSAEITEIIRNDARLDSISKQEKVIGLLTHLKVLELLLRALDSGIAALDNGNLKQMELLNFLWTQWIVRQNQSLVRGRLLQRLGVLESQKLSSGYVIRDFDAPELQTLPTLLDDNLLVKFEEHVYFAHDFVADLSRLRVLLSSDMSAVAEYSRNFQWHGALKLFAQHLAEQNAHRWLGAIDQLINDSPDRPPICDTLLVDGMIMAADADPQILRTVLPTLAQSNKHFFALLLDRVALVGTLPDEHWQNKLALEMISMPGPWRKFEGGAIAATLYFKNNEPKILAEEVPPILTICEMVLRRSIIVGDVSTDLCRDASELSLRIAKNAILNDQRYTYSDSIQSIYRCMLLAASVSPAESAELALFAAQRREHSEAVCETHDNDDSDPVFDLMSTSLLDSLTTDSESVLEPWPDGPLDRVDDNFREVCLESDALVPMIDYNPAIAKEIFLACCIEEPKSRSYRHWDDEESLCVAHRLSHRPPFYDVGPMLSFFSAAPNTALDIIIRLCNFATDRWYESKHRVDLEKPGAWFGSRLGPFQFEVPSIEQSTNSWKGSCNIYRWSLGGLPTCKPITNVLMAFEVWVYREIEAQRDVSVALARVVAEGRSAGLAGCLLDIGKKYPQLFLGPLMPLLGCWVFYGWDRVVRLERSGFHEGFAEWSLFGSTRRRTVAFEWHKAKHRQTDLLAIATRLFVGNQQFREFMQLAKAGWQSNNNEIEEYHALQPLRCLFDWSNYIAQLDSEGKEVIVYTPPAEQTEKGLAQLEHANQQQLLLTFPFQCSQLIEANKLLSQETIDYLWTSVKTIDSMVETKKANNPFPDDERTRKPDAFMAGAAALLKLGGSLLSTEQIDFCRSTYEDVLHKEPARSSVDMPESVGHLSWDYFFADLTIEYLTRNPEDIAASWGVERCIIGHHYGEIEYFMKLARDQRSRLSDLYTYLPNYVIKWSALREQLRRIHSEISHYSRCLHSSEEGDTYYDGLTSTLEKLNLESEKVLQSCRSFSETVASKSPITTSFDAEIAESTLVLQAASEATGTRLFFEPRIRQNEDDVDHADIAVDLFVLHHGFAWIDLSKASSEVEFERWQELLLGLLATQSRMFPTLANNQRFSGLGYGHKFDMFVHRTLAENIVRVCHKDVAILWKTKLSQVRVAPDQIETFLEFICAAAHDESPEPAAFVTLWAEMIDFANDSRDWAPEAELTPRIWTQLVAMDFHSADSDWAQRVSTELNSHWRVLESGFNNALKNPSNAKKIVLNTCAEVWFDVRAKLLVLYGVVLTRISNTIFPSEVVCRFLTVCWEEFSSQIVATPNLDIAFTSLLNKAVQLDCREATLLAERVDESKSQLRTTD